SAWQRRCAPSPRASTSARRLRCSSRTNTMPELPVLPRERRSVDARVVILSALSILIALASGFLAQLLTALIGFVTSVSFYGRASWELVSPAENHLGAWVIGVPVIGGILVGIMARYGSKAIRGHGIPEAMENVL